MKESIIAELRYYFGSENVVQVEQNRQRKLIVLYPWPYRKGVSIQPDLRRHLMSKKHNW